MVSDPYNFVSALNCILAQRLVRMVCRNCQRACPLSEGNAGGIGPGSGAILPAFEFKEGTGCLECNGTGYHGRTAIHELLDLSDRIRDLIIDKKPTSEIKRAAHEEGMTSLRESAVSKVLSGETTLREINKVTFIE
jgi:type IV pilus assembly protein PilB